VCGSGLVYPFERRHVRPRIWRVLLTCTECHTSRLLFVTNREIDALLTEVEWGLEEIADTLAEMVQRHMVEECAKFICALEAGHIQPIDF
jgi:hypothetical protein